jgi:endogenous inhibitor of DNA gyrase (YacG/DUF329 family)
MTQAKSEGPFSEKAAKTPAKPCPVCGKPALFTTRPFCSKRCASIDLHRWLGGIYAIPAEAAATQEADPETGGQERQG